MDDSELLRRYVDDRSEEAFSLLVRRHVDLVYAAACRQVRDPARAEEITQSVFIVLARRASKVHGGAALPGWLLSTTRYAALNAVSSVSRRRFHEQQVAAMAKTSYEPPDSREPMTPLLDEAFSRLSERDRSAVALRFLQGKSMREVATAMGLSEAAANKRVMRAVERMRGFFRRRGVTLESASFSAGMTQLALRRAPALLAHDSAASAMSVNAAVAGAGGAAALASAVIRTLAWMQMRLVATAASLAIVGAAAAVVLQSRNASMTRAQASRDPAERDTTIALHASDIWMPYVPNDSPGTQVTPIANTALVSDSNHASNFFVGVDPQVKRVDKPAAVIRSLPPLTRGAAKRAGSGSAISWQAHSLLGISEIGGYRNRRRTLVADLPWRQQPLHP